MPEVKEGNNMRFPENDPAYHHWLNMPGSKPVKKPIKPVKKK
ncbi:hypothetical protein LCGC14_1452520 [marine sediment metagenome]|uniref:Uncharacterized protein n=1 Tax=marine sediment metagenome TaxID=412755 RepID=A0A0F9LY67_9ZZZZ